jgi:hypothetical protein
VKTIKRIRPSANGHFKITIPDPAGKNAAIYRLTSRVRANTRSKTTFPTASLPETIELH